MEYGGGERRKTKKDLKRKRLARVYKRGGGQRTHEHTTEHDDTKKDKEQKKDKKNSLKKRKRK